MKPTLTYDLAHAIAWDETKRRLQREGRTVWTPSDYRAAADLLNRILDDKPKVQS